MADAVSTIVEFAGKKRRRYRFTCRSDATGESAVTKIDTTALTGPSGVPATYLIIEDIQWSISGFTSVNLLFDATTDDVAATLSGVGQRTFPQGLKDPKSTGSTGKLLLTSYGAGATATYDIVITVRVKP